MRLGRTVNPALGVIIQILENCSRPTGQGTINEQQTAADCMLQNEKWKWKIKCQKSRKRAAGPLPGNISEKEVSISFNMHAGEGAFYEATNAVR